VQAGSSADRRFLRLRERGAGAPALASRLLSTRSRRAPRTHTGLHAVWVTTEEGCPRGSRCLVYRRAEAGKAFGPKEIVRAVPEHGIALGLPVAAALTLPYVAWVERAGIGDRFGNIRVAIVLDSNRGDLTLAKKKRLPVVLEAPRDLVTGRRVEAKVTGQGIREVTFTLVPPVCPPGAGSCYALRRPVRVTRTAAPFRATFSNLPEAPNISTTDPLKNTLCGADAYLYVVRAEVVGAQKRVVLTHNVSVCPRVR
jgi:hypothetical protein